MLLFLFKGSPKGRIHCEIFLSRHFMKSSFRVISWNVKYFYFSIQHSEAVVQMCSVKKVFLEISQNSHENTCTRVSFLIKLQTWGLQLYLKKSLAQVFSCEFCGISKNTFSYRTPLVAASEHSLRMFLINKKIVFTEKRYRVKFSSIKKHLLLIKQKQKNSKIPKRIWMKPCSKTRSGKSACANIFLELLLTI